MADGHKSNSISQELGTVCEWQQVIIVFNMTMTQEAHGKSIHSFQEVKYGKDPNLNTS